MSDVAGRSTALTMITPLRRGGATWMRTLFWAARHFNAVKEPAVKLSFIHFASWTVLDRLPTGDGPSRWQQLRQRYLFFESNFDGSLPMYIDNFAHAMRWRMRGLWGTSAGNAGLFPIWGFTAWGQANSATASHFYCAYPEATTTMVTAGLAVSEALREFLAADDDVDDDTWAASWRSLLATVQTQL